MFSNLFFYSFILSKKQPAVREYKLQQQVHSNQGSPAKTNHSLHASMTLFAVCDFSPFVLGAEAIKWIEAVELPANSPLNSVLIVCVHLHRGLLHTVPAAHPSFCTEVTQHNCSLNPV